MIQYNLHADVDAFTTQRGEGLDMPAVMSLRQAHGTRVALVPCDETELDGVDALITDSPGLRIGIRTADCVPILVYDTLHKAIAAIHSGWKGTAANIIAATFDRMHAEYGTCGSDVCAVIGPCIHMPAFEVGDEVYDVFAAGGYGEYTARMAGLSGAVKWHVDLPGVCAHQLRCEGVQAISVHPECTYDHHDRLYSYRHDADIIGAGRMYTCIMIL